MIPEQVRLLAALTGTPLETAETIYEAYVERSQSLQPEEVAA